MAEEKKKFLVGPARLTNNAFWEKDQFTPERGEPGKPKYKCEIVVKGEALEELENALCDYAVETWGSRAEDRFWGEDANGRALPEDDCIISPLKDGDAYARKRERAEKPGDVYKGGMIMRCATDFNHEGDDAPGGIAVYDEEGEQIDFMDREGRAKIYNGCYVKVLVSFGHYTDSKTGQDAINVYLIAAGFADKGERLASRADHSSVFKPTGRREGEGTSRRRARKG